MAPQQATPPSIQALAYAPPTPNLGWPCNQLNEIKVTLPDFCGWVRKSHKLRPWSFRMFSLGGASCHVKNRTMPRPLCYEKAQDSQVESLHGARDACPSPSYSSHSSPSTRHVEWRKPSWMSHLVRPWNDSSPSVVSPSGYNPPRVHKLELPIRVNLRSHEI